MRLQFAKMHGLGNDFVVLDQVTHPVFLNTRQIQQLGDRHRGIGFDQLIYVEAPLRPDADFHYRVFNADGQEIEHCGNGARCFYRFARDQQLTWKGRIQVSTEHGGLLELAHAGQNMVSVDMDEPQFGTDLIPRTMAGKRNMHLLEVAHETFEVGLVSMGNPHCVMLVPDVAVAPVHDWGPLIGCHPWFPQAVNVGFMEVVSPTRIKLRVFERGVGETQACGTGACAALAIGRQQGWLDEKIRVELPGGSLQLSWKGPGQRMTMMGPAISVFQGAIEL